MNGPGMKMGGLLRKSSSEAWERAERSVWMRAESQSGL